jgi:hypothetical protein
VSTPRAASPEPDDDFDFSTPEAEAAIRATSHLILEIREDLSGPLARKVALYERTLGLAVVPVLIRRAILRIWRRRSVRLRGLR